MGPKMPKALKRDDQRPLLQLATYRDVGSGYMFLGFAFIYTTLIVAFVPWGQFHHTGRNVFGLAVLFAIPTAIAVWGIRRIYYWERWYITPEGTEVVLQRRAFAGFSEERFLVANYQFELSRKISTVGFHNYWLICLQICSRRGSRRFSIACARLEEDRVAKAVLILRELRLSILDDDVILPDLMRK